MHVVFNMNVFKESNVCVSSSSYQMKLEISANYIIYSNIFNVCNIISNSFFLHSDLQFLPDHVIITLTKVASVLIQNIYIYSFFSFFKTTADAAFS